MKTTFLMTFFLIGALTQNTLEARPGGHGKRHGGFGGGHHRMLKDLDLTKEQRDQVKTLRKANKEKTRALRTQMREARKGMFAKMKDPAASEADLRKSFEALETLRNQMSKQRFEESLEIRKILTPAQREQLAKKVTEKIGHLREKINDMEEFSPED